MQNVLSNEILHQSKVKEKILFDSAIIIAGSIFMAISSQFAFYLPFTPIPITGQTLAVLLCGTVLGSRRGGLSLLLYVLEGAIGLPVFAGGHGGMAVLLGPTAGYLIGFIPAAFLVGSLAEKGFDRHWYSMLFAFLIGQIVIYFFGAVRLLSYVSFEQIFRIGVAPFLIGDAIKASVVMVLLPSCWKIIKKKID